MIHSMLRTPQLARSLATRRALSSRSRCDVAVIGGGVVGLASARRAAMSGYSVVLLESEDFLLTAASGTNSGIFTDAHDTCSETCPIEHACLTEGTPLMAQLLTQASVPIRTPPLGGSLIVAMDEGVAIVADVGFVEDD